jgi:hypothetical protein
MLLLAASIGKEFLEFQENPREFRYETIALKLPANIRINV